MFKTGVNWIGLSEQFLNGTSAQLGYTVPFTSVYIGKYVTKDKSKTDATKLELSTTHFKYISIFKALITSGTSMKKIMCHSHPW